MKLIWEVNIPAMLNQESEISLSNRRIWATLGPLDFPREVIVSRQDKRVQMEFHYHSPPAEKLITVQTGDTRITRGKRSGRVFYIQCEATMDLEEIQKPLELLKTDALTADTTARPQRLSAHYAILSDKVLPFVIDEVKHEIMLESR